MLSLPRCCSGEELYSFSLFLLFSPNALGNSQNVNWSIKASPEERWSSQRIDSAVPQRGMGSDVSPTGWWLWLSCHRCLYLLLLLYKASDLGLQLLGNIDPYLELEQTSLSNKYSNVPGLWVLECDQKFNAKGKVDLLFQQVMNCCLSGCKPLSQSSTWWREEV